MSDHTPTPWHSTDDNRDLGIRNQDGVHVTDVRGYGLSTCQNHINKDYIITACNAHEALKEALEHVIGAFDQSLPDCTLKLINDALALADGKEVQS